MLIEIAPGLEIVGEPIAAFVDVPYAWAFGALNGSGPYQWESLDLLPDGWTLDGETGLLAHDGPPAPGWFEFRLRLRDADFSEVVHRYLVTISYPLVGK